MRAAYLHRMDAELERVGRWIRGAGRVVYVVGAGLSVPSGIRAYRSGPDAIWDELVTSWGTRERLEADPAAWWKTFWLGAHADLGREDLGPNDGHRALARLVARDARDLVITQNVDGLHRRASHPDAQLVEIHGRHDRFVCTAHARCVGGREPIDHVDLSRLDEDVIPRCAHCRAPMRPLVLLFDELYDSHPAFQARRARRALVEAEVAVFVGTSFSVGITSLAIRSARFTHARVVNVNVERAPFDDVTELTGSAADVLPRLARELDHPSPDRDTVPPANG